MNAPTASDWLTLARLLNGTCAKCGTINAHDGTPRCDCARAAASSVAGKDSEQ